MRTWKVTIKDGAGGVWRHHIHDDGSWEQDKNMPPIDYMEHSNLIVRLNAAAAQFTRLGWQSGEIERE